MTLTFLPWDRAIYRSHLRGITDVCFVFNLYTMTHWYWVSFPFITGFLSFESSTIMSVWFRYGSNAGQTYGPDTSGPDTMLPDKFWPKDRRAPSYGESSKSTIRFPLYWPGPSPCVVGILRWPTSSDRSKIPTRRGHVCR